MVKGISGAILTLGLILITASSAPLWGQAVANAQISGIVTDSSGAAVPNARITATQTDTGQVRTTVSGPDGTYVFPDLPVGPYKLEAQLSGFNGYVQNGIRLEVSNNISINIALKVGEVRQQVEVTANATMVQAQETSVAQVVDQKRIVDLPLNGRQATQLIMLAGAANDVGPNAIFTDVISSKNYFSSDNISVAGGQATGTNYLLDGGTHMDVFSNVNLPLPFPDALQEFSVETSTLTSRYGMHPGATVNAVTKSGTNQIHGDAFEFVRNGDFNARDFFAPTQDSLKRNQFGGTIGAPILKDKLFGFFGYQGTRIRTAPPSFISYVPTAAALGGDFSALESANCQSSGVARTIVNPATGQTFANNYVDPSLFNQQALNLAKYMPASSDPCGQVTFSIPEPQREDQYVGRMDWNQNSKHNLFGRYFFADYASPAPFSQSNILLSTQRGVLDRSQSVVLGDTYSLGSNTLNVLHLTLTRLAITRGPSPDMINFHDIGVNIFQPLPNYMQVTVNGHFMVNCGTCAPGYLRQATAQVADDVDTIRGRHHLMFGGEWVRYRFDTQGGTSGNGQFYFNGAASNDSLLDYLLGVPSLFIQGNLGRYDGRQNYVGIYGHDSVRLNSRLTLQLGVRWEPYLPAGEIHNRIQHFDEASFLSGTKTNQFLNAPPGLFFPGDPGMPSTFGFRRWDTFEPRVGLAWQPTGSGRQTLRAGFGFFYDTMPTAYWSDQASDTPWGSSISLPSPGSFTNPYVSYPGGNPFPLPSPPNKSQAFPLASSYMNYPLHSYPPSVYQWNLSYQLRLASNWLFSANYLGNKSTHIWTGEDVNPGVYIPGMCNGAPCSTTDNTNQRRVLDLLNPVTGAYYSDITQGDDGANGEYNALLLSAQHRFGNHYTILGNYTYSHCIDEGDFTGDLGIYGNVQNPFNRNADRGNCGFDIRHVANMSFVAEMPRFSNPWTNRLLGNWQLSPIVSVRSGTWFTPFMGVDNSLTGIGDDRPDVIGNPYTRDMQTQQWLNPNSFTPNAIGKFGNAGSQSLVGPNYVDLDVGVSRYFNVKEHQRFELRFEFFNTLNHVNFNTPDNYATDSTYGVMLSDYAPRILQFAMKYTF